MDLRHEESNFIWRPIFFFKYRYPCPGTGLAMGGKPVDSGAGLGNSICSDEFGNTYMTGKFMGQLQIGDSIFHSRGQTDIFLAKYNAGGQVIWATHAGGGRQSEGMGVALMKDKISLDATNPIWERLLAAKL